jgi:hypothetical protein
MKKREYQHDPRSILRERYAVPEYEKAVPKEAKKSKENELCREPTVGKRQSVGAMLNPDVLRHGCLDGLIFRSHDGILQMMSAS